MKLIVIRMQTTPYQSSYLAKVQASDSNMSNSSNSWWALISSVHKQIILAVINGAHEKCRFKCGTCWIIRDFKNSHTQLFGYTDLDLNGGWIILIQIKQSWKLNWSFTTMLCWPSRWSRVIYPYFVFFYIL